MRRELDPVAALLSGHFRPIYNCRNCQRRRCKRRENLEVRIEQSLNEGRADYALFDTAAEQLLIIVEAKRLGDQKLEHHIPQAVGYAEGEGSAARYSVITNGNMWRVFENGNGLMRNSNILAVSIMSDPADHCAKGLARLLSPPRATIAMPFGEKTRRIQPSRGGIPTTGHLLDAAYGPLFTSPDLNRAADAQPDAGAQPGVEQPPLL